jgi:hypothetical protein
VFARLIERYRWWRLRRQYRRNARQQTRSGDITRWN